ncbi:myocardin-related transcription factor B isoform X2 [Nematostella vectensis]|uniref:myocardin-related transcription factor B isoform X2 n=1 Tax=Nematostella vectensis TaxID=45351 RepID=UPI00207725E9|nr:myocardin-related transcription factor B isoform X2 [Nematostella vectensis]XP_048575847.1 myocardin-related transcription factor B isoform X2 [Nematostella vectensis]
MRQRRFSNDKNGTERINIPRKSPSDYADALERKLQLRRPREQLINQGIMPAAMTAPGLLSQKSKLERAKTGDLLQKKIRVRPNRAQLVQRHILDDTSVGVDPSLIAKQIQLKRKKLEDDLNDKLLARPGPLELVKENILEAGTAVGQAVKEGEVDFTDTTKSALLQPISPDSESSPIPSPDTIPQAPVATAKTVYEPCMGQNSVLQAVSQLQQLSEGTTIPTVSEAQGVKKERRKKAAKPKFKKYKYHEYRPPNGEVEKSSLPMDSPYALMLQQQQLYLQLQVLYQNYPCQFVGLPSIPENSTKNTTSNNNNNEEKPVKIEDMRVVDMRKELKLRGLPVSGSKTDLIERLKASSEESAVSSQILVSSSSPSIMATSGSVSYSDAPINVSSAMTSHGQLSRSNSLPLENPHVQQLQMQLIANNQKLNQQYSTMPEELQKQLQQLQYLNLQMQLQRLNVQQPQVTSVQTTSPMQQPVMLSTQQMPSPNTSIKQEPQPPETCIFSQQPPPQPAIKKVASSPQFSYNQTPLFEQSQSYEEMNFHSPESPASGLVLLQAEANRLNHSPSHSEQDLRQIESTDFSMGWSPKSHQSQDVPSPNSTFMVTTQADAQARLLDGAGFMHAKPKMESMQRSYSNSERSQVEDGKTALSGITMEAKPRSNSEPPQPFSHKRSSSLPSGVFFVDHIQPPPSYEAHMAGLMQRKVGPEYSSLQQQHLQQQLQQQQLQQQQQLHHQQQQQQQLAKSDDTDMDTYQEQEITQELQRAMMKQQVGLDHDEILEILGASISPTSEAKVQTSLGNQVTTSTAIANQMSPHNPMTNHHHLPNLQIPKSPSTGFLGTHILQNQPIQARLSKSCEDVAGVNLNSNKNSMQICNDGSFPDFEAMIMSPSSPMKIDNDNDYQGIMMHPTNSIPIPGSKNDSLSWLDLNNSPIITSTSPGSHTDVTYATRGAPPASLYDTSPNLSSEHFPMSLFELDGGSGHLPHDFPEAMDFCV